MIYDTQNYNFATLCIHNGQHPEKQTTKLGSLTDLSHDLLRCPTLSRSRPHRGLDQSSQRRLMLRLKRSDLGPGGQLPLSLVSVARLQEAARSQVVVLAAFAATAATKRDMPIFGNVFAKRVKPSIGGVLEGPRDSMRINMDLSDELTTKCRRLGILCPLTLV